jgi:Obg family GTPase CgtA-like protein
VIAYVLDGEGIEWSGQYQMLLGEIEAYSPTFTSKQRVILVNKNDLESVRAAENAELSALNEPFGVQAAVISAKNKEGIQGILDTAADTVPFTDPFTESKRTKQIKGTMKEAVITPRPPDILLEIRKIDGGFDVVNEAIERMASASNLSDWRARLQFHRLLDTKGILKLLKGSGARPGDTIRIGAVDLEWS